MSAQPPYGYPQPGYPQSGHPAGGYPGYGWQPRPRRVGIVGAVISSVGALIAIAGLFLDWYSASGFDTDLRVITAAADSSDKQPAQAMFGWLLWVLLTLTIVAALLANVPGPLSIPLRILAPLLGLGCVFLTLGSLHQLLGGHSVLDHATVGLYALVAGTLLTGFGGVVGPRRG